MRIMSQVLGPLFSATTLQGGHESLGRGGVVISEWGLRCPETIRETDRGMFQEESTPRVQQNPLPSKETILNPELGGGLELQEASSPTWAAAEGAGLGRAGRTGIRGSGG